MAIPKICGLEHEYAIIVKNAPDFDPIRASYLVVNSFERAANTIWDYDRETPFLDARGFSFDDSVLSINSVDNFKINNLLKNGARFYVDHAHPEFSTAECATVTDLIAFDRAGDRILDIARQAASDKLPEGEEILIYKNNSDHNSNSYGCHENYLVSKELYKRMFPDHSRFSQEIFGVIIPFFVTRQIFCGAGKVGSENGAPECDYQISSRSDFFEIKLGANTTANRPIVNTRDEPHADRDYFRRLHVIVGDSNMCEISTLLKIGTTRLILSMLEDGYPLPDFELVNPVEDIMKVSHDLTLNRPIKLKRGDMILPLELQEAFLEQAEAYCKSNQEQDTEENRLILQQWRRVLSLLRSDRPALNGVIDWVTKLALLQRQIERKNLHWKHARILKMDIAYHDICRHKGLYNLLENAGRVERVLDDNELIKHYIQNPPSDTRAYFRSQCLKKYGKDIAEANWDVMHFRDSDGKIKKVPLLNPSLGTKERVEHVISTSETIDELLNNLQK